MPYGFSISLFVSATTSDKSSFLIIAAPNILLPLATPCLVKGKTSLKIYLVSFLGLFHSYA